MESTAITTEPASTLTLANLSQHASAQAPLTGASRFSRSGANRSATGTADQSQQETKERPIRVLIVEDEALVALDMTMILDAAGFQVLGTSPTGDAALSALAAAAVDGTVPDLVLMDIALRGEIDGVETTQRIKSKYTSLPVAFVTGQADPATRTRAEATHPVGYLLKPFTPEQLVNFIRTVVSRS